MPRLLVQIGIFLAGGKALQLRPGHAKPTIAYHGVVITGGHDVDPVLYAQESEVHPRYDAERDAFESAIINDALERKLPLLGICRGAQLLNVCLGGDLHQELRSRRVHTSNRWTIFPLKTLHIFENSRLHQLLDCDKVRINNLHNQGIDHLGNGLRVSGRDLDEIAQAVEDPTRSFLMGVQWHPEFLIYLPRQRKLFQALVAAARQHRDRDK
jgi:putative glutamine amidotransferase